MKKIFGIGVPVFIILIILGLLFLSYSYGRKGLGCDLNNEPGVIAGKKDHQIWIDEIEKYKSIHGTYPTKIEDLDQNVLRIGKGFSHPNVTGGNSRFDPANNKYEISFTFKNDYVCLLGQIRECTYRSETKKWTCP